MLYDPKWEVKVDPLSLESLIMWLESQPATAEYDFHCSRSCMVAQWVKSIDPGAISTPGYGADFYTVNGANIDLRQFVKVANAMPWTFGAALERARSRAKQR